MGKYNELNLEVLSDNEDVIKKLKQVIKLEKEINELDEFALPLFNLQRLAIK